jgi:hypothetical protein
MILATAVTFGGQCVLAGLIIVGSVVFHNKRT